MTERVPARRSRYGPLRRDRLGERQVTRELTRHLSRIERTAALVRAGIDDLGSLHRYITSRAAATVALAQDLITSANQSGQLTPAKQEEFQRLTRTYLANVSRVTKMAGQEVIKRLLKELVNSRAGGSNLFPLSSLAGIGKAASLLVRHVGLFQGCLIFGLVLLIGLIGLGVIFFAGLCLGVLGVLFFVMVALAAA